VIHIPELKSDILYLIKLESVISYLFFFSISIQYSVVHKLRM